MIDKDLVRKKLAVIESCVHELKTLGRPSEIQADLRELRFEAYTPQIPIQSALEPPQAQP